MSTDILTPERVESVFSACVVGDHDDWTGAITVHGIAYQEKFDPNRIDEHRQEILDMLAELPDVFRTSDGASFLKFYWTKQGNDWTDNHETVKHLVLLGLAIGELELCPLPKLWSRLPDMLPHFILRQ